MVCSQVFVISLCFIIYKVYNIFYLKNIKGKKKILLPFEMLTAVTINSYEIYFIICIH